VQLINTRASFDVNEVFSLLKHYTPVIWSWGFKSATNYANKTFMFGVSGFVHKGLVAIYYNAGLDMYQIDLLNSKYKVVKTIEEVYVEDLVDILDFNIEKNTSHEEYCKKVNKSMAM
jgi:hypothetical protein